MKNFKAQVATLSIIMAVTFLGLIPHQLKAQAIYKLSQGKDININVLGSSNVHDQLDYDFVSDGKPGRF